MGPPRTFRYALFSQTTLEIKNKAVNTAKLTLSGQFTFLAHPLRAAE